MSYLDQIACDVTTGDVKTTSQVGQGKAFVYGTNVSDAVSRIDYDTRQ